MTRFICTALVILGLTFQPFAVAWSASSMDQGMEHAASAVESIMDEDSHNMKMDHSEATIPCHEKVSSDSTPEDCDECCGMDCPMLGRCATSCTVIPFTAIEQASTHIESSEQGSLISSISAHVDGRSSSIYHPPKHY